MEPMTIFAISACILSAGIVYVVLKVNHSGESQMLADQLLKVQTEMAAIKKKLLGYTKFADYLDAAQPALADQLKAPVVKLIREYVHVEPIPKEKYKLKSDATVIVKYSVEYLFSMDVSPAGLNLMDAANGVGLKISRLTVFGEPTVKTLSHQVISVNDLPDCAVVLADILTKFTGLTRVYGSAIAKEEAVRALCKLRALESLRDFFAKQTGVTNPPAVFVDFIK
jgi:hypothetical protein